ncbi:hypothetical protein AAVH_14593 [Aphelenchoides avenae]|nr:hypothetical protein AAVH_14593 [Aphelenchus avenae]
MAALRDRLQQAEEQRRDSEEAMKDLLEQLFGNRAENREALMQDLMQALHQDQDPDRIAEMPPGREVAPAPPQQQQPRHDASPITITRARIIHLFNAFLKGKHLTHDANVEDEVTTFMLDFDVPAELVRPLQDELQEVAQAMRERRPRRGQ